MSAPNYNKTRFACYYAYLAMASIFVLPSMLFTTFHQLYGISFTLTQPQEVVLGFQIDLKNSSATTEMRAETIKLLYYGK